MHTRASNSELVEPLPEPERTLNRRLRRRNRRVPYDQRNNPPQNPRIVYPSILNINYFRHFIDILRNYDPMDDEPMWAADHVVAPTPANEFAIKALFDRLLGEIRAFSQHDNESLTDAWLRMKEMLRNCHGHNLSKVDPYLLMKDIMRFKTYEDYKDEWIYEWNTDVPWVYDKPWLDNGIWKEPTPVKHTCKPYKYKTGCSEWPTCSWRDEGYYNGGNLLGTYIIGNQLHYQDYEWYEALEDYELKNEALRTNLSWKDLSG
ncbi:hypothetical protein Tco_0144865 [Tanacetum coccineum]